MRDTSRIIVVFLILIIGLSMMLYTTGCDDVEKEILDMEYTLVPGSYDGPAPDMDADIDDWEWKVEPKPEGKWEDYKYKWHIMSNPTDGKSKEIYTKIEQSGSIYYRFTDIGKYDIYVTIVDKADRKIGEASATVITRGISITASETWIRPGQEVEFTIKNENPPKDPVYGWDFDDGSGEHWETGTTMKHVFENPGWYVVSVSLREKGRTEYDYPGTGTPGYLAHHAIEIHAGHPATLITPLAPLYAGVKYEFSLEYDGKLPDKYYYWWDFYSAGYSTDVNKIEYTFPEAGTYTVRCEIRHTVNVKDKYGYESSTVELLAFGEQTITVEKAPELKIKAPAPPLQTGTEYTFKAEHDNPEKVPAEPYYEWDFGDGSGKGIPFNNEATHLYSKDGNYTIKVTLYDSDQAGAAVLGTATVKIEVEAAASHLTELHQMKKFALHFAVQHDYVEGMSGVFVWGWESYGEVTWDGVNGFMEWAQYNHSERMTCRVSEDGTVIEQLKIRHEFVNSKSETEWFELEIQNLPFWEDTMPDRFIVDVDDEDVPEYVVYFNSYRTARYQWTDDARLYVQFVREF